MLDLVNRATEEINNSLTTTEQIKIIGQTISEFFGGEVKKSNLAEFGYELEIIDLKRKQNSNVIPLGQVKSGLYRERALLFKIICDRIGVPATLEQGEYGRSWNCIDLDGVSSVVDLVEKPGEIYPKEENEAASYISV